MSAPDTDLTDGAVGERVNRRVGVWRTIGGGWPLFLGTVLLTASAQAATVLPGAVPGWNAPFLALFVASLLACVLAVAVLTAGALHVTAPDRRRRFSRPLIVAIGWVVVVVAVALLSVYLVPAAIVLGLWWSPVLADGADLSAGLAMFRRPVSATVALVASAVLVVVSWVVALLAGLFLTGALGAFLTWIWIGLVAVVLVVWWTCLYRRVAAVGPNRRPTRSGPAVRAEEPA